MNNYIPSKRILRSKSHNEVFYQLGKTDNLSYLDIHQIIPKMQHSPKPTPPIIATGTSTASSTTSTASQAKQTSTLTSSEFQILKNSMQILKNQNDALNNKYIELLQQQAQSQNQHDSDFTTKELFKMIPKFNGKKEQLRNYINIVNDLWEKIPEGAAQSKFISILRINLSDEAALVLEDQELVTWEEIRDILQQNFKVEVDYAASHALLQKMKQNPGESIESFVQRIKKELIKTKSSSPMGTTTKFWHDYNEKIAIQVLEDGIYNIKIQSRVVSAQKKTFNEASQYAIDVDARLKIHNDDNNNRRNSFAPITCNYCKKRGHKMDDCRLKKSNEKNRNSKESFKQNGNGFKCDFCGLQGHTADRCFKNPKNKNQNSSTKNNNEQMKKKVNKIMETQDEENQILDNQSVSDFGEWFQPDETKN